MPSKMRLCSAICFGEFKSWIIIYSEPVPALGFICFIILSDLIFRLSARADKGSDCAKCGLKCGICCFYCLEKFIRYLNHNAYTIITIDRCNFCKAAGKVNLFITMNTKIVVFLCDNAVLSEPRKLADQFIKLNH